MNTQITYQIPTCYQDAIKIFGNTKNVNNYDTFDEMVNGEYGSDQYGWTISKAKREIILDHLKNGRKVTFSCQLSQATYASFEISNLTTYRPNKKHAKTRTIFEVKSMLNENYEVKRFGPMGGPTYGTFFAQPFEILM